MNAKWLVELDLYPETEKQLIQAIKNSGREVKTLKDIQDWNIVLECSHKYDDSECVVFYGSISIGKKLKKNMLWIPGVYMDTKKYDCTSYYPVFGNELLHDNYIMIPFGDLIRRKGYLFNLFGSEFFIRPNSGLKPFVGNILTYNDFEYGIELANFHKLDPDLLVVVSDTKKILKEWRFVIVNQEVVSGSLYRDWTNGGEKLANDVTTKDFVLLNSKSVEELCTDEKAFEYANKVAKLYNPETVWTIDICQYTDCWTNLHTNKLITDYKVIEINSFSCAGLYANDLNKVVNAVSIAAEKEWFDYNIE